MSVLDLIRDERSKQVSTASRKQVIDSFLKQKTAIQSLKGHPGYNEIKKYRVRSCDTWVSRLKTAKLTDRIDLFKAQGGLEAGEMFLAFLDRLENAPILPEEEDRA